MLRRISVKMTTDAAGAATVFTHRVIGKVVRVFVDLGDLAAGAVDFTVTGELSAEAIYTGTDLATDTLADATTAAGVYVWAERIKVIVAAGGDTKSGEISFLIDNAAIVTAS